MPRRKKSSASKLQSSLKQEILQLEKRLRDQFAERRVLEKALGYGSSSHDNSNETLMPKPTKELIKEITVLELEVVYLEQYLLSLYRKAFNQQISSLSRSTTDERLNSRLLTPEQSAKLQSRRLVLPQNPIISSMRESNAVGSVGKFTKPSVPRSQSSLSQRSVCSIKPSPPVKNPAKVLRACHSLPLSFQQCAQNDASNIISLAEHLGARIEDLVPETPNKVSEEMIRCMGAIYCKLADPPLVLHGRPSSPSSSLSSVSAFSPRDQCDMWSPRRRNDSSFDERLESLFKIEGLKEFSGPYSTMVEVQGISRDNQRINDVEPMLKDFRSLVSRLEKVDPRSMKNEEKLAFWINTHNALVMQAYLEDAIPQNSLKRGLLLSKVAYNVGGQILTAETIQSSILGCRTPRPGQWLRTFFFPKMKFKSGDDRQSYAIEHPEPLLHFALSSGSRSDPAVRIYTAKRVFQELEAAKEEYIMSLVNLHKEHKILLPKLIESFAKDSSLRSLEVIDMIQKCLPENQQRSMQRSKQGRTRKSIEWVSHNFAFRYFLSKELVK
eukprot:TRINITY_DN7731_c0_g2_i2.p1 TRINITY_DN7731_c0_g2~~TRINITY_DN7731_c0_g2_i2.p1  ORF type:complete len:553 (-),score=96.80 TRINITY_DN7731_c0_g2_i2:179-1837(-)